MVAAVASEEEIVSAASVVVSEGAVVSEVTGVAWEEGQVLALAAVA